MIFGVLGALMVSSALYALILHALHNVYAPDYTWITVVIGNGLICAAMFAFSWLEVLPIAAAWLCVAANVAAGAPIIVWQVLESYWRMCERNKDQFL